MNHFFYLVDNVLNHENVPAHLISFSATPPPIIPDNFIFRTPLKVSINQIWKMFIVSSVPLRGGCSTIVCKENPEPYT